MSRSDERKWIERSLLLSEGIRTVLEYVDLKCLCEQRITLSDSSHQSDGYGVQNLGLTARRSRLRRKCTATRQSPRWVWIPASHKNLQKRVTFSSPFLEPSFGETRDCAHFRVRVILVQSVSVRIHFVLVRIQPATQMDHVQWRKSDLNFRNAQYVLHVLVY